MRTGRSLTVCRSLLPGGRGCLPGPGGVLLGPGGGWSAWSGGVLLGPKGGWSAWSRGGLLGPRGGGVCLVPGGTSPETDTCKNITLATTSLRPVKISLSLHVNRPLPGSVKSLTLILRNLRVKLFFLVLFSGRNSGSGGCGIL